MSCNADCKCRKGIVALVFVPGIMGTRLMNKKSGDSVWDPAAGAMFDGPSSTAMELKAEREAELAAAQADDDDGFFEGIGKWFTRRWISVKEVGRGIAETGRKVRTKAAAVPRIKDLLPAQYSVKPYWWMTTLNIKESRSSIGRMTYWRWTQVPKTISGSIPQYPSRR
ncbi:hypothetical protein ACWAU3_09075 [Shewanella sp. JL219SE-S6]